MTKINYVVGDATAPNGKDDRIICHICNDLGLWGSGFVMALSAKWKHVENHYRRKTDYVLGTVDIVRAENNIWVANIIGQHKIARMSTDGLPPVRYEAIKEALIKINKSAIDMNATLHMPRMGCDRAGGEWSEIEKILNEVVTVECTVYDLP